MSEKARKIPAFWTVFAVLLRNAWRRAASRRKRQQEILRATNRSSSSYLSILGSMWSFAIACLVQVICISMLVIMVDAAYRMDGVPLRAVDASLRTNAAGQAIGEVRYEKSEENDASRVNGRQVPFNVQVAESPLAAMTAASILLLWATALVFQGEGLELDVRKNRNPVWEWLLNHPISSQAILMAEIFSPIVANVWFKTAPLFIGCLFGYIHGLKTGILAGLFFGFPLVIGLASLSKAIEIAVMLRIDPRSHGAVLGIMNWLGYAMIPGFYFFIYILKESGLKTVLSLLQPLAGYLSWSWFSWFFGLSSQGQMNLVKALLFHVGVFTCLIAVALAVITWSISTGLAGVPRSSQNIRQFTNSKFGMAPLRHKEILWFIRDRSALIQAILIPMSIVALHAVNSRSLLARAGDSWNYLCAMGIMFGVYFLAVLGLRSLDSEGPALWLAETWPGGIEDLMKTKARLWFFLTNSIVSIFFLYAVFRFPEQGWKSAAIYFIWLPFGYGMAVKAVTGAEVNSNAGQLENVRSNKGPAVTIGALTFVSGVISQRWHIAITGFVYSSMTAAAMWQNFKLRIPFIFDPWSEKAPRPPTIMHAMISIIASTEAAVVITTGLVLSSDNLLLEVDSLNYWIHSATSIIASIIVLIFLQKNQVPLTEISTWTSAGGSINRKISLWCGDGRFGYRFWNALGLAAFIGVVLGVVSNQYSKLIVHAVFESRALNELMGVQSIYTSAYLGYCFLAIVVAPFAEELLFRGLLFRSLKKQWGLWPSACASAVFFGIFHPPEAWPPVMTLGLVSCLVYLKTGRLIACIVLHVMYNFTVLILS